MKDRIKDTVNKVDSDSVEEFAESSAEQVDSWRNIARDLLIAYKFPISIIGILLTIILFGFRLVTGGFPGFFGLIWNVIAAILGYALYVVPIGGTLGIVLYFAISTDNSTRVLDLHPLYSQGEYAVADMKLGEEIWDNLTVVNTDGEKVPKDSLNQIEFRTGEKSVEKGYEVMGYDLLTNTATATYLGESSLEMRQWKKSLERIEAKLLTMADWGVEELLDQPVVARMIAARVTRYLVNCHAKATLPNGEEVTQMSRDVLAEMDYEQVESLEDKLEEDLPDDIPQKPEMDFEYAQTGGEKA